MPDEKRKFTRISFKVVADVCIGNRIYAADEIRNLSVGGCLVSINQGFAAGTACRMDIWMTGSSSDLKVSVEGEVIRGEARETAIRFTRIDPDSLYHLRNIILYNSPDPEKVEDELEAHPGLI